MMAQGGYSSTDDGEERSVSVYKRTNDLTIFSSAPYMHSGDFNELFLLLFYYYSEDIDDSFILPFMVRS